MGAITDTEIIGRLNGITAEVGTIMGYSKNLGAFVSVAETGNDHILLKRATAAEMSQLGMREPSTVAEHSAIHRRMTPYGLARLFGPRPRVKPQIVQGPSLFQAQKTEKIRKRLNRLYRNLP